MKIDSQGYATVIPAGELDSDEIDCLQSSSDSEQPSQMEGRGDDNDDDSWRQQRENGYAPLTPQRRKESDKSAGNQEDDADCQIEPPLPPPSTTPQDYEVPLNILQHSPSRNSSVASPRLIRQRSTNSTSESEIKRLSCTSHRDDEAIVEGSGHREAFDSGIETSVDSHEAVQMSSSQDSSESQQVNCTKLETSDSAVTRSRSRTVSGQDHTGVEDSNTSSQSQNDPPPLYKRQASVPSSFQPKALHISLDQNKQVIV